MPGPAKKKSTRKLSSLFGLGNGSKTDSGATASPQSNVPNNAPSPQPRRSSTNKLKSTLTKSASIPNLSLRTMNLTDRSNGAKPASKSAAPPSPLAPPPTLAGHMGNRPLSSPTTNSSRSNPNQNQERDSALFSTPAILPRAGTSSSPNLKPPSSGARDSKMLLKRQSWLPKKSPEKDIASAEAAAPSASPAVSESKAWIAGLKDRVPYDLTPLLRAEKIHELWNDKADTFVYLFPQKSAKGPSFKVPSSLLSGSKVLLNLSCRDDPSNADLTSLSTNSPSADPSGHLASGHPPTSSERDGHVSLHGSGRGRSSNGSASSVKMRLANDFQDEDAEDRHLYMPLEMNPSGSIVSEGLSSDELELLVLYRNFFAFLSGGALVATRRQSSLYAIFLKIGTILTRFGFTNFDGSDFGEVVTGSFERYCEELRLLDVRGSREKTIEAIVLGEKMKAWPLYREGFVHGTGKLSQMKSLQSPKYNQITPVTRNRLERSALDLEGRIRTVQLKLEEFEFPSMFAGIANSQVSVETKNVRFRTWKTAFFDLRRHVVAHYRQRYGAWPPNAKSKKNSFEESGLNRVLLQAVYSDFTDLYDMLVDRTQLTDRTIDMLAAEEDVDYNDTSESIAHAIRRIESEYDRSTPPVQPPIPFDLPLFPRFSTSFYRGHVKSPSKEKARRLRDNKVNELLLGSYNRESMKATPFLEDFLKFERRCGQNSTVDEIADIRCGQWLFVYAVLQSLPMVIVDAREIQFSERVEYFLCVPPRGGRPWMKEDTSQSRSWFNVSSGGGVVSMPADVIDHSVEGIYRRSHCWTVAAKWAAVPDAIGSVAQPAGGLSEYSSVPPPVVSGPDMASSSQISAPYPEQNYSDLNQGYYNHSSNASVSNASYSNANFSNPSLSNPNLNQSNPSFHQQQQYHYQPNPNPHSPSFTHMPEPHFQHGHSHSFHGSTDNHGSNNQSPTLTAVRPVSSVLPRESPQLPASMSTPSLHPHSHLHTPESRLSHNFSSGLEALPLPRGIRPDGTGNAGRPISIHDPNKTFDSILAGVDKPGARKKR